MEYCLIVTSPFIMVVLIVFWRSLSKEREKARYDLYLKSVESGHPYQKRFLKSRKETSKLQQGAVWLAVGWVLLFSAISKTTVL